MDYQSISKKLPRIPDAGRRSLGRKRVAGAAAGREGGPKKQNPKKPKGDFSALNAVESFLS